MPNPNTTEEESTDPNRRTGLGTIFLTVFLDLVGFSIIFPLFPAMLDHYFAAAPDGGALRSIIGFFGQFAVDRGTDPEFFTAVLFGGFLGSVYSLLQFVFAPVWGALSDRIGRRRVLLLTVFGTALSYLLWIFAGPFWILLLARLLGGTMAGNVAVATAAVADVTSRGNRSRGMALIGVAFGLGFVFGPAIGGLASLFDLSAWAPSLAAFGINPFSVPALAAFLLAVINWIWVAARLEETLPPEKRRERASLPVSRWRQMFLAESGEVRRAILIYFVFIFAFSGMEFTLTFLALERLAYGPAENVRLFLFVGVILLLVQGGLVRRLAPRVGEKPLILAGVVAGMLALALLALSGGQLSFFAGLALLALGVGLTSPTLSGLVSLYSPESDQGRDLGAFRAAGSFARACGPLAAAVVYWSAGSMACYLAGAAILALLVPLSRALRQPQH